VDFAIGKGYSTIFHDRLGAGKPTALSQIHVLRKLKLIFQHVRIYKSTYDSSSYLAISDLVYTVRAMTGSTGVPKSLVLVGHSFGSAISAGALTLEPDLVYGVVLTGMTVP
jgi:pimeloyl-ACP methyl ester carboxylesterase